MAESRRVSFRALCVASAELSVGDKLSTVEPVDAVRVWKPVVLNVPSVVMLKVTGVDERIEYL